MILLIIKMICSLSFYFILSCTVPLPKAASPPGIPFKVVFCIDVGGFKNSSGYGVTQPDAPKSMMACVNSCAEAFLAINIANFNSVLFWSCFLVRRGGYSSSSLAASGV
jgi:hypothetical protein